MPVAGFVRLRKHQFGRQQAHGTKVAATRAYPFTGVPSVDLTWTDVEADLGSIDPVAPPYRGPGSYTADLEFTALTYNDLALIFSGFFGGAAVPVQTGTSFAWPWTPASETVDTPDEFSYEFGDDRLDDWYQFGDGIIESFEITGPEGLGPLSASTTWRFGSMSSTGSTDFPVDGVVPAPNLAVARNDALVYLKDLGLYIADAVAGLGAGLITDALHSFVLRGSQEIDEKRWAQAAQSFDVDAWGRGQRAIELECTFAKTDQTVGTGSESDDWMSEQSVDRYARLIATSLVDANPGTPHSWTSTLPMRYYTRTEGEVGQNSVIVLNGHAFYDDVSLAGVFPTTVVNMLSEADLGLVGS